MISRKYSSRKSKTSKTRNINRNRNRNRNKKGGIYFETSCCGLRFEQKW